MWECRSVAVVAGGTGSEASHEATVLSASVAKPTWIRESFFAASTRSTSGKRRGQRAPHKPLLLLLALGRLQQGKQRLALYELDIRDRLRDLLRSFGPQRRRYHPEFPFWYLRSDQLWEIPDEELATIKGGSAASPSDRQLTDLAVHGGLPEAVHRLLEGNPDLVQTAAQRILDGHFAYRLSTSPSATRWGWTGRLRSARSCVAAGTRTSVMQS